MKKFDLKSLRTLPVFLSLTVIGLTSLIRGDADESQLGHSATAFSLEEMNADLDMAGATQAPDFDAVSADEYDSLKEREKSIAIEEEETDFSEYTPAPGPSGKPGKKETSKRKAPARKKPSAKKKVREVRPARFTYTEQGGLKSAWPKCTLFMDAEGNYGSYGRIVTNYIDEKVSATFLSNEILGMSGAPQVCPKWSTFDDAMKKRFWVWTMASIGGIESSCNNDVRDHVDVTGNYAFGMYQLERSDKLRFANRKFAPHCMLSLKELRKPVNHIRCAMDMLVTQLINQKSNPVEFDGRIYPGLGMEIATYFNELQHANGGYIGDLIRQFKPCRE